MFIKSTGKLDFSQNHLSHCGQVYQELRILTHFKCTSLLHSFHAIELNFVSAFGISFKQIIQKLLSSPEVSFLVTGFDFLKDFRIGLSGNNCSCFLDVFFNIFCPVTLNFDLQACVFYPSKL